MGEGEGGLGREGGGSSECESATFGNGLIPSFK